MRLLLLECDNSDTLAFNTTGMTVQHCGAIPTRKELRIIDELCASVLPEDPTPSLAEIQARPDAPILGDPQFAPQTPSEALRVIVHGTDAALSAVLTRLMRADTLWVEVAYVPVGTSTAAALWNLPSSPEAAWEVATQGTVHPKPLIRDDAGVAVAATATVTNWENQALTGEIIVDSTTLAFHDATELQPRRGVYGALLTSTVTAPGIAAWQLETSLVPRTPSRLARLLGRSALPAGLTSGDPLFGRALQAGGRDLQVRVDGQSRKRPVKSCTFYRHLRDLQAVRPAANE